MNPDSKGEALAELDAAWAEFREGIESVPAEEMDTPGVVDEWCLKELLGHVTFWSGKAAHDLRAVAADKAEEIEVPAGQPMVDQWNAREAACGKVMPTAELRSECQRSYEDARRALAEASDDNLAHEVSGWSLGVRFAEDTYRHYREHLEHIRAWQRQLETSEA